VYFYFIIACSSK